MRSRVLEDELAVVALGRQYSIVASEATIRCYESRPSYSGGLGLTWCCRDLPDSDWKITRDLERRAIYNGERPLSPDVWTIPFWFPVVGLTMLSALLIWWTPEKQTP